MATLDNKKHEDFARCLAEGLTQDAAYIAAGYSPKSARAGASILLSKCPEILTRRDEIREDESKMLSRMRIAPVAKAAQNLGIDKQRILEELWDNAMQAKAAIPVLDSQGQEIGVYNVNWTASNQALTLIGKELGMFGDKKDAPVDVHEHKTVEELRQIVIEKSRKLGVPMPDIVGESVRVEDVKKR